MTDQPSEKNISHIPRHKRRYDLSIDRKEEPGDDRIDCSPKERKQTDIFYDLEVFLLCDQRKNGHTEIDRKQRIKKPEYVRCLIVQNRITEIFHCRKWRSLHPDRAQQVEQRPEYKRNHRPHKPFLKKCLRIVLFPVFQKRRPGDHKKDRNRRMRQRLHKKRQQKKTALYIAVLKHTARAVHTDD